MCPKDPEGLSTAIGGSGLVEMGPCLCLQMGQKGTYQWIGDASNPIGSTVEDLTQKGVQRMYSSSHRFLCMYEYHLKRQD